MDYTPEHHPDSSPIPFRSHTALLLSAALPYLQPSYRHPIELALKFLEFSETMKLYREFHMTEGGFFHSREPDASQGNKESGFLGLLNNFVLDLEGLLNSLSKVCTGSEKEVVDMFLNLIRVKNFYETYGDLMKMSFMSSPEPAAEAETEPATDPEAKPEAKSETGASPNLGGFPFSTDLTSMLSDEQKETLDLLKNLFSAE